MLERDVFVALELWLTATSSAINFVIFLRRLYWRGGETEKERERERPVVL